VSRRSASPSPQGPPYHRTRYKTPVGDIGLVALKGKLLAFVEVKQRKHFEDAGWSRRNIGSPEIQTLPATTSPSTWCWPRLGPGLATSPTRFQFD
jgi:hypothetical protein